MTNCGYTGPVTLKLSHSLPVIFVFREDYVEILKKYIPVDVFGACGSMECTKDDGHHSAECNEKLERDYR